MHVAEGSAGDARISRPIAPAEGAELVIVPAWVLTFVRLRRAAGGNPARAWAELPNALPAGAVMPGLDEAATVLMRLNLMHG